MYNADVSEIEKLSQQLPQPVGYKLLLAVAKLDEKKGSLLLPDQYRALEDAATIVGCVLRMGTAAYNDAAKFPTGPWCKIGDWVIFRSYSGTRLKVGEQEIRLINDDQIEAVIDDPRVLSRAGGV